LALVAPWKQQKAVLRVLGSSALATGLALSPAAGAAEKRGLGSITGSGFVFKDKLQVDAFKDPQVEGVTIYLSDFERPITDRLSSGFFSDPSQAGLGCVRRTTPLKVKGKLSTSPEGDEIISEARSLLFKSINVRRVYDQVANSLVYVQYSTRLNTKDDSNKARFASALCVVPLDEEVPVQEP